MRKRKSIIWTCFVMVSMLLLCGCSSKELEIVGTEKGAWEQEQVPDTETDPLWQETLSETILKETISEEEVSDEKLPEEELCLVVPEGATLETRFRTLEGFVRVEAEEGSLCSFFREYPLKEDGSPVLLHSGKEKGNQFAHAAVFALPIEDADLQQCADSVMRMYAEYYWYSGQFDKIAFHFTNGFLCEYSKWRDGYRVKVNGNVVNWSKDISYDDSYETFVKYLRMVFNYAGTLSMDALESESISLAEMRVGDVILKGGSPGHVVLVVDMCENAAGEKAWLLAQGYMPAQEFHVLNNPEHEADPWYYESEMVFPLSTPEYTFYEESMVKRLTY